MTEERDIEKRMLLHVPAPRAQNNEERLAFLRSLNILDSPPDEEIDELILAIARVFNVPQVLVTLVDEDRQWFKAAVGFGEMTETPFDHSFCAHTFLPSSPEVLLVPDALNDDRFKNSPIVLGWPHIRFYCGSPIIIENIRIGALCLVDNIPRLDMSKDEALLLSNFAEIVAATLVKGKMSNLVPSTCLLRNPTILIEKPTPETGSIEDWHVVYMNFLEKEQHDAHFAERTGKGPLLFSDIVCLNSQCARLDLNECIKAEMVMVLVGLRPKSGCAMPTVGIMEDNGEYDEIQENTILCYAHPVGASLQLETDTEGHKQCILPSAAKTSCTFSCIAHDKTTFPYADGKGISRDGSLDEDRVRYLSAGRGLHISTEKHMDDVEKHSPSDSDGSIAEHEAVLNHPQRLFVVLRELNTFTDPSSLVQSGCPYMYEKHMAPEAKGLSSAIAFEPKENMPQSTPNFLRTWDEMLEFLAVPFIGTDTAAPEQTNIGTSGATSGKDVPNDTKQIQSCTDSEQCCYSVVFFTSFYCAACVQFYTFFRTASVFHRSWARFAIVNVDRSPDLARILLDDAFFLPVVKFYQLACPSDPSRALTVGDLASAEVRDQYQKQVLNRIKKKA